MKLTSDVNKENKEVNIIDPNPNNSYKTKKKFAGSYTEVNPIFPSLNHDENKAIGTLSREFWIQIADLKQLPGLKKPKMVMYILVRSWTQLLAR